MNSKLRRIYEEYEDLLFKLNNENMYVFHPFDEQDAEYWLHIYDEWLSMWDNPFVEDFGESEEESYYTMMGHPISKENLKNERLKTLLKASAIWEWYVKQGLKQPEIGVPFDHEWIAMEEGYNIRIEKWYDAKLEKIKNKFSHKGTIQISSANKYNFYGTIYNAADELRLRKDEGKCETYKEAWEYGEKYWTVNGNPVTYKQLEKTIIRLNLSANFKYKLIY